MKVKFYEKNDPACLATRRIIDDALILVPRYFEWISPHAAPPRLTTAVAVPPGLTTAAPGLHCLIENSDEP